MGELDNELRDHRWAELAELDRITFDPNVLCGKACIRGMRISAALVVRLVASMSHEEIIEEYPCLESDDITQALLYAALAAEEKRASK